MSFFEAPVGDSVFGLNYDSYTIDKIREILYHCEISAKKSLTKPLLWDKLQNLRYTLGNREKWLIREWLGTSSCRSTSLLDFLERKEAENDEKRIARREKRWGRKLRADEIADARSSTSNPFRSVFSAVRNQYTKRKVYPRSRVRNQKVQRKSGTNVSSPLDERPSKKVRFTDEEDELPNFFDRRIHPIPQPVNRAQECSACMESFAANSFPKLKNSASCGHNSTFCTPCLAQAVDSKIDSQAWDQITCPECPSKLAYEDIKRLGSGDGFQRYAHKSFVSVIEHDDDFIYCLGPNCNNGQIHYQREAQPIMTCSLCDFKTCFIHKMPWHKDLTCAEYDEQQEERKKQEESSERLIAKTAKACPNPGCGQNIEKSGGCDHMTCTKCKHEFCWACMASYEPIRQLGNASHADTCKWHPDGLSDGADEYGLARGLLYQERLLRYHLREP